MTPAFRLGTTSFIHPEPWSANVDRLAGLVQDVELLLFEADPAALPDDAEIARLRASKARARVSYSVHGPLEASLASADDARREASVAAVRRVIDVARPLAPEAWILHLYLGDREGDVRPVDIDGWRAHARSSLRQILRSGVEASAVCVESLDYDFALIEPLLDELGLSAALDLGHCLRDGRSPLELLRRSLRRARVVHWHGVDGRGRDHRSLRHWPRDEARAVLEELARAEYAGVLTLEVFGERDLRESLELVGELRAELGG